MKPLSSARATAACGQQPGITEALPQHDVRCFHPSIQIHREVAA